MQDFEIRRSPDADGATYSVGSTIAGTRINDDPKWRVVIQPVRGLFHDEHPLVLDRDVWGRLQRLAQFGGWAGGEIDGNVIPFDAERFGESLAKGLERLEGPADPHPDPRGLGLEKFMVNSPHKALQSFREPGAREQAERLITLCERRVGLLVEIGYR